MRYITGKERKVIRKEHEVTGKEGETDRQTGLLTDKQT